MDMSMLDNLYDHKIDTDNMSEANLFRWEKVQKKLTFFWNILIWQ